MLSETKQMSAVHFVGNWQIGKKKSCTLLFILCFLAYPPKSPFPSQQKERNLNGSTEFVDELCVAGAKGQRFSEYRNTNCYVGRL